MLAELATCRFCHLSNYDHDQPRSALIKYGVRHSAHLSCLKARNKLADTIRNLTTWQRGQLPALELQDLGMLPLVRQLAIVDAHRESDCNLGRKWPSEQGCQCEPCTTERKYLAAR